MSIFSYQYYRSRIPALDYLRGMAILMVLLSHYPVSPAFEHLWTGVDLFFVLSGYLVTGILLKDIDATGRLRFKRFFIRRGLKIYPSFYFFLFSTVLLTLGLRSLGYPVFSIDITWPRMLAEIFYVQNIVPSIWVQTWSLGVEEQFYLTLPLVLFFLLRTDDVVRNLFRGALLVAAAITIWRFAACAGPTTDYVQEYMTKFYFRLDALFLGVAAACAMRLFPERILRIPVRFWLSASALGIAIVPAFAILVNRLPHHMASIGYTLVNWSFVIWMLSAVVLEKKNYTGLQSISRYVLLKPVASIGLYSYNIYLWHVFMVDVLYAIMYSWNRANILFPLAWRYLAAYLVMSVLMGYFMTRFLEVPLLKWRDRKFQ